MEDSRTHSFKLSLIVPVFNEDTVLKQFFERTIPIVQRITDDYEIICINDGSFDQSLAHLMLAHARHSRIKVVDLSRNFGKEAALTAGLEFAGGDAVVPLDADLQDPPELIPELVERWREGYDVVLAVRERRSSDPLPRRHSANLFYNVMRHLSDVPIPAHAGDFRLIDRRVVEALKLMPERARFMKGLFAWVGFRQATIGYARPARVSGRSKWRSWQLWNFALEGLLSSTTLPLRIWTYLGTAIALSALGYMMVLVMKTLINGVDVPGYPSLAAMILFFSGMNMIGLGIIGEYLGRVFIEVKRRPQYLVRQTIGFETPDRQCHASPEERTTRDQASCG